MLRKKISMYFNHEKIYIAENGVIVLDMPSCIIRKKSRRPILISSGFEAYNNQSILNSHELFCRPLEFGKINDVLSARLLIKDAIKKLYTTSFVDVNVLVPTGITKEDLVDIKNLFISIGYSNVTFTQVADILGKFLQQNNKHFALLVDIDSSEVLFTNNYSSSTPFEISVAYSTNISLQDLAQKIKDYLLNKQNFNTSIEVINKIILKSLSLFQTDPTKIIIPGFDSITDKKRNLEITASDIYPVVFDMYIKLIKFFAQATNKISNSLIKEMGKEGIICLGPGCNLSGFDEFVYKYLQIGCVKEPVKETLLIFLSNIYSQNEEWIFDKNLF